MPPVSLLLLLLTSPDPESQTLSAGFTRRRRGGQDHHLLQGLGLGLGEGRVLPVPPDSPTSTGGRYRGVEHAGVVLFRSMCALE